MLLMANPLAFLHSAVLSKYNRENKKATSDNKNKFSKLYNRKLALFILKEDSKIISVAIHFL